MNQAFYANQLVELIESNMLDTEDEMLMERLQILHDLLGGVLCAQ
jgi:Trp operon repressor